MTGVQTCALPILVFVLPRQGGKCLISTTNVATPSGSVQIKDLKVGDIVYGYNKLGKIEPTVVRQVHVQGVKKVVDIKDIDTGETLVSCTKDHRNLFILDGKEVVLDLHQYESLIEHHDISIKNINKEQSCYIEYGDEYEAETYDIGIDNGTHLYCLANGLVTHNSYGLLTLAIEEAMNNPGWIVNFVCPTKKQARDISRTTMREILKDCPEEIMPYYRTADNAYVFHNGSELMLYGANSEAIEAARGPKAHLIICDEVGFWTDMDYAVKSVLYPKLNTTKGKLLICSTPPVS